MPLSDGYETEKGLKEDAEAIAEAITDHFNDNGKDRQGFILFVCEFNHGTVQYISDLNRVDVIPLLKYWIAQNDNIQ